MEQLASFDIIWNMLTEALIKESNINQTAPGQFLPPKYVCDMFEKLDATSLAVPSMIQENQEKKEMDTACGAFGLFNVCSLEQGHPGVSSNSEFFDILRQCVVFGCEALGRNLVSCMCEDEV